MKKRCGITIRPDERKKEWKRKYGKIYYWKIVKTFKTKKAAQNWENLHDSSWEKSEGGRDPDDKGAT